MNNKQWINKQRLHDLWTAIVNCLPLWSHQMGGLRDWLRGDRNIWSLVGMWSLIATAKNPGSSRSIPLPCHMIAAASHWWGLPTSIEYFGSCAHAPCGWENKGGQCAMLDLSNSLIICSSLVLLMFLGKYGGYWVHGGWKPLHRKRHPAASLPKILVPWCPVWLHPACLQCASLRSPQRGAVVQAQSPCWDTLLSGASPRDLWFRCVSGSCILHCMFHCETASTYTLLRQSIRLPTKPQADSIPELSCAGKSHAHLQARPPASLVSSGSTSRSSLLSSAAVCLFSCLTADLACLCFSNVSGLSCPDCWIIKSAIEWHALQEDHRGGWVGPWSFSCGHWSHSGQ